MSRTVHRILVLATLVGGSGCSGALTDPENVGPVIARYGMTALDGNALPCCAVDSAGVQITIVGGALTFHGPTNYSDTVYTPAGAASRACVHGIPDGALVTLDYTVRLADGTTYLLLPCDRGTYAILVVRQRASAGSSSTTDTVTISFGNFAASRDHVELVDSRNPFAFHASVTAPTIFVKAPGHQYRFDPEH
jgi:hypothetical protein